MLIISLAKEQPTKPEFAVARAMYALPGVICFFVLAGTNPDVTSYTVTTNSLTIAMNSSEYFNATETNVYSSQIQSQAWTIFHYMMGLIMLVYVIFQILITLGIQPGRKKL